MVKSTTAAEGATKTLIGGIALGYTTYGAGFAASVFVGGTFSFL